MGKKDKKFIQTLTLKEIQVWKGDIVDTLYFLNSVKAPRQQRDDKNFMINFCKQLQDDLNKREEELLKSKV